TILTGRLIAHAGNDAQKKAILPGVVEGKKRLAFAHTEKGARYNNSRVQAKATRAGDGWELAGEKHVVLGAPLAETLVVSARTDKGASLCLCNSHCEVWRCIC